MQDCEPVVGVGGPVEDEVVRSVSVDVLGSPETIHVVKALWMLSWTDTGRVLLCALEVNTMADVIRMTKDVTVLFIIKYFIK